MVIAAWLRVTIRVTEASAVQVTAATAMPGGGFGHRLPSAVQFKSPQGLETVLGSFANVYFILRATDSRYAAPETHTA